MFSIIIAAVCFVLAIPVKVYETGLNYMLKKQGATGTGITSKFTKLKNRLYNKNNKEQNNSTKSKLLKLQLLLVKGLKALGLILKMVASILSCIGVFWSLIMLVIVGMLVAAVGGCIAVNSNSAGGYTTTSGGTASTNMSASTSAIIAMSESEVWQLISEGKYSSYDDANKAAKANPTAEETFWSGLLVEVEVPCWKWNGGDKQDSTCTIKVNKYVSEYFKDFMTDLYNCPEKYCIDDIGGYCFRTKNNGSSSANYSGHSFGATLDINWNVDGMGSVPAGISNGYPWKTSTGLSDELASKCCTMDNSWHELAKKYALDWGGNWSSGSLDPMHFSLVGDCNKDTRGFTNKYEGRTP